MNKKATIASALVDFVAYGVFVVMLVVFYYLFKISAAFTNEAATPSVNKITAVQFPELNSQQFLTNYLMTPVELSGEKITMADYIAIAVSDESITSVPELRNTRIAEKYPFIKSKLDDYISKFGKCYLINANIGDDTSSVFSYESGTGNCDELIVKNYKPARIPTENGGSVSIRLMIE